MYASYAVRALRTPYRQKPRVVTKRNCMQQVEVCTDDGRTFTEQMSFFQNHSLNKTLTMSKFDPTDPQYQVSDKFKPDKEPLWQHQPMELAGWVVCKLLVPCACFSSRLALLARVFHAVKILSHLLHLAFHHLFLLLSPQCVARRTHWAPSGLTGCQGPWSAVEGMGSYGASDCSFGAYRTHPRSSRQ